MNIFILDSDAIKAAQLQCNAHVVKMVVESAQMLSTAHRMLDGHAIKNPAKPEKSRAKLWIHPDPDMDSILYKAVHYNHPCTVWTMASEENYLWHYQHFVALCDEFTHRYDKVHKSDAVLRKTLIAPPKNIAQISKTQFPLAMGSNPECMFPDDPVKSYRMFYQTKQDRFKMAWTRRDVPDWFKVKEAQLEEISNGI
jgi:hypothetical protein